MHDGQVMSATKTRRKSSQARKPRRAVSPTSPLWRGALELAGQGFRVFPLKPRSKEPAIREWQAKATTSPTQLARWWKKWPDANVGVVTGEGLVVVDLDGAEAYAYAREKGFANTPSVETGRAGGGQHLWFSGEGRNSRGTVHPDIDVRGLGGYVVAPPSVHPDTGALYEWLVGLDRRLALLPEWATAPTAKPRLSRGIEGVFVEGERNDKLYDLACAMRGIGMTEPEIEVGLLAANDDRCDPPLEDDDVVATARSAANHPANWKPDNDLLAVARLTRRPTSLPVYIALRKSCGYGDRCFMSYEKLNELTGKSHDALVKAVDDLVACGLIERKKRQRKGIDMANEYRLREITHHTLTLGLPPGGQDVQLDAVSEKQTHIP